MIFFCSCTNQIHEQEVTLVCPEITTNKRFKDLLQQFAKENPSKNCLNKVFIDKIYEVGKIDYKNIITIQQLPFNQDDYYKLKPIPILKLKIDATNFFLYSGIEDYLTIKKVDSLKSSNICEGRDFVIWTVIDQKDTFLINKQGIPPFSPFSVPTSISPAPGNIP